MSTPELVPSCYLRVRGDILEQWYCEKVNAIAMWPPEKWSKGQWRPLARVTPLEIKPAVVQSTYDPDL